MNIRRILLTIIATSLLVAACAAQSPEDVVKWTAKPETAQPVKAGEKFTVDLAATIEDGWHVYSITQAPGGPTTTIVTVPAKQAFKQEGVITGTDPHKSYDPNFEMKTETYDGSVSLKVPMVVRANAPVGAQKLDIDVLFQTCNDTTCLPPTTVHVATTVKVAPGKVAGAAAGTTAAAVPPASGTSAGNPNQPEANGSSLSGTPAGAVSGSTGEPTPAANTSPEAALQNQSLWSFIWLAMGMGALSLLTPCVFPMIPITVSYFTKHASHSRASAIRNALIYGLGIILTFTALGLALAAVFGAAGVNQLAASPWVNLLITVIFVGFALSLFGAYFIQVPPGLVNKLDGITRRQGTSEVIGTLVMGLTFTLTSFTCTAPFVGTLLVMASQGSWKWPIVGMLSFSTVFALPFFILALAPQLMAQLPKSGGWMNSVKVVMGFLEIAAAMKFLSNADLIWHWGIFTREMVLAIWVAIGILTVLYLLGKFTMSHDSPLESVTAMRVVVAIVFLSLTVWLATGLFGRPLGTMESFLPPPSNIDSANGGVGVQGGKSNPAEMSWVLNNYDAALAQAKQQNKLVFVDFTGYTCTNCRWMEANMFPRADVRNELQKFVRVRLYTDGQGPVYEQQQKMEKDRFGTVALPFYAILTPDGKALGSFPGLTRKPEQFMSFLTSAQDATR